MRSRGRSISRLRVWTALVSIVAAGACNTIVGLDDLEHTLPDTKDSGGACSNAAVDCPPTGSACKVPLCGQDGACAVEDAAVKTPCAEGGGAVCSGEGACVGCVDDSDCEAPEACGKGGVPGVCGCEAPCHVWSQLFDGLDTTLDTSFASTMAVDPYSNAIFVTGWFSGALDFGKGGLTSVDGSDAFLAKIDAGGSVAWTKTVGGLDEQLGFGVAATSDGGVIWTGSFKDAVNFGDIPQTSQGLRDAFVLKFKADGVLDWLRTSTGEDPMAVADQLAVRAVLDPSGNIFVMGHFAGGLDFGSGVVQSGAPPQDVSLTKFSPDGAPLWTKGFGDAEPQRGPGITTDADGHVLLAGTFGGNVSFGGGAMLNKNGTGEDIFVAKLDDAGGLLWNKSYGNDQTQYVQSVGVDSKGDVYVAGDIVGLVDFDGEPLKSEGDRDAFVLKLEKDGDYAWCRRFGDANLQGGQAVVADGAGGILVAGRFAGTVDFGNGPLTSPGGLDSAFLLKLDATTGKTVWSRRYGETGSSYSRSLALDGAGNAILFGFTNGTADFGGGPLVSTGANSMFLAKFRL